MRLREILIEIILMPTSSAKPKSERASGFDELDRVKLKKAISVEGRTLDAGLTGTIVLCHGTTAYEVEFDAIDDDVFGIPAKYLETI